MNINFARGFNFVRGFAGVTEKDSVISALGKSPDHCSRFFLRTRYVTVIEYGCDRCSSRNTYAAGVPDVENSILTCYLAHFHT